MCIIRQIKENKTRVGYCYRVKNMKVSDSKQHSSQWVSSYVLNFDEMTMRSPYWEAWEKYCGDGCAYICQTNGKN